MTNDDLAILEALDRASVGLITESIGGERDERIIEERWLCEECEEREDQER